MIFPLILAVAAICQVAPASSAESVLHRLQECFHEALDEYRRIVLKQELDFIPTSGRISASHADNTTVHDNSLKPVVIEPVEKKIELIKPIERDNLHPFWRRRGYTQQTLEEKPRTALNLFKTKLRATYLNDTKLSWNQARNSCLDKKVQLAIIDSEETETFLINFMKEHNVTRAWIGVHSLFGDNRWTTIKGDRLESLPYVHWEERQPDNHGGNERCVVLNERGMNDLACDSEAEYICH